MDRKLLPIFLIVLVDILGLTIMLPLLPFYAERFGASPLVVGLLTSTYAACQLFSGPLLGRWSDRIGRKPLLLASQFGTFLGLLLLAAANSLPLIFLARVLDGSTAGNISLAQAYISDVTAPKDRARAFGKIGMAFGIGFFLGPALSGLLAGYGFRAPILVAAALSALSMVATVNLLPAGHATGGAATAAPAGAAILDFRAPLRFFGRKAVLILLLQLFLFYLEFSAYVSGFALFAERRFTYHGVPFGTRQVGYLFAYFGFLGILLQGFLIGPLVHWLGERRLTALGFGASLVGYAVLSGIHEPLWILFTGVLTGIGNGVIRPCLTSELSRNVSPREQGEMLGLNQSLNSVAQIIAPLASTALIGGAWLVTWAWLPVLLSIGALVLIFRQREGAPQAV